MSSRLAFRVYSLLFVSILTALAWQNNVTDRAGHFVDITAASGVSFQHIASHTSKKYLLETMGSGVALFDYDNDGRLDIFLVNGATLQDPTRKGADPAEDRPQRMEPALSPETRRHIRRRYRQSRIARHWIWHGSGSGRLRQRR